jgi:hypothetical protein
MYEKFRVSELRKMLNSPSHRRNRASIIREIKSRYPYCSICLEQVHFFSLTPHGVVCKNCTSAFNKDVTETFRVHDDDLENGHEPVPETEKKVVYTPDVIESHKTEDIMIEYCKKKGLPVPEWCK